MDSRTKIKQVMTPIWNREMGQRLRTVRMITLRRQVDLAALLTTESGRVHPQQIDKVEKGWLDRLHVTWAHLEKALGAFTDYVLTGKDAAYFENRETHFSDHYQRAMRKRRNGPDPKKGECPPNPVTLSTRACTARAVRRREAAQRRKRGPRG